MVLNVAHRGFSGKYPENTLLAFRKAIEMGVDMIETDVRLSRDFQAIIIHDPKFNRTTNGQGRISSKNLSEIRTFRTKERNQPIPTLEEVFPLIRGNTKLIVELKGFMPAWKVAALIKKHNMQNKVIVSSGSVMGLRIVKNEIPNIQIGFSFYVSDNPKRDPIVTLLLKMSFKITHLLVIKLAEFTNARYINLFYGFSTRKFIRKLKSKGYVVTAWNVNTSPLMKKLIKNGIDGIYTNYPDKLKRLLSQKKKINKRNGLLRHLPF